MSTVTQQGISPVLEGQVYRVGDVVQQIMTLRYMQLFEDGIVQHQSKQSMLEGHQGKVFSLDGSCTLSTVREEELLLRPEGVGTLQAMVVRDLEKKLVHGFTIHWESSLLKSLYQPHLLLSFSTSNEANKWHDNVQSCIAKLPSRGLSRDYPSADSLAARAAYTSDRVGVVSLPTHRESNSEGIIDSSTAPLLAPLDGRAEKPRAPDSAPPAYPERMLKGSPSPTPTKWARVKVASAFYNGISLYAEQEEAGGNAAIMGHTVIRATPREVFEAILGFEISFDSATQGCTVLETYMEDSTQVLHCRLDAEGTFAPYFGQRDFVAQRSWRIAEDGTHIITMHSVEHPLCPPPKAKSGISWFTSPARAELKAAVFSIKPLKDKHLPPGVEACNFPKCLLTIVINIDVGGTVGWFGSYSQNIASMWLRPLFNSVVILRERMEHMQYVGNSLLTEARPSKESTDRTVEAQEAQETFGITPEDAKDMRSLKMDSKYWNCPGASGYKVRGKNYLQDKKKILSEEPAFSLESVCLVKLDQPTEDLAKYLLPQESKGVYFVVNIIVGTPANDHLVMFWHDNSYSEQEEDGTSTPFHTCLARFVFGDGPTFDSQRNDTFKLIPQIAEGSWVIKQAVGSTPVLLGNKLRQVYHRGPNYFEVDVDVSSDRTARSIVGLVAGATKSVVVNMGILIQGQREDELPERLLGTVQLNRIDMEEAKRITQQELNAMAAAKRKAN